jgi:hypothetical protein
LCPARGACYRAAFEPTSSISNEAAEERLADECLASRTVRHPARTALRGRRAGVSGSSIEARRAVPAGRRDGHAGPHSGQAHGRDPEPAVRRRGNKPGAGGTIGTEFVARQPADGYTVLLVNAIPHTASRKLYPELKYDPIKSFTPIGAMGTLRYILAINNEVPAKDYAQFVGAREIAAGKLNYASAGVGSTPHLAMELYKRAAGVDIVHVPYQGSGPGITDLLGGRVQVIIENVPLVPLIKSGKVRALAITARRARRISRTFRRSPKVASPRSS